MCLHRTGVQLYIYLCIHNTRQNSNTNLKAFLSKFKGLEMVTFHKWHIDIVPLSDTDTLCYIMYSGTQSQCTTWVTYRATWVTHCATWVTHRATWVTYRATWVTHHATWVTYCATYSISTLFDMSILLSRMSGTLIVMSNLMCPLSETICVITVEKC